MLTHVSPTRVTRCFWMLTYTHTRPPHLHHYTTTTQIQGKLLALELLVKVLHNPQHRWDNVRSSFTLCLRQVRACVAVMAVSST
jgi:hypothetical protein